MGPEAQAREETWRLLEAERGALLRIARRRTASAQDAEDAVQEAIVRTALVPDLDLGRAAQYAVRVLTNLCVDSHRARQRLAALDRRAVGVTDVVAPSCEAEVCDRAFAAWLAPQTQGLGPREQAVLAARVEGVSTRVAADRLRVTVKSAESALSRARLRMSALAAAGAGVLLGLVARLGRRTAAAAVAALVTGTALVVVLHPGPATGAVRPVVTVRPRAQRVPHAAVASSHPQRSSRAAARPARHPVSPAPSPSAARRAPSPGTGRSGGRVLVRIRPVTAVPGSQVGGVTVSQQGQGPVANSLEHCLFGGGLSLNPATLGCTPN